METPITVSDVKSYPFYIKAPAILFGLTLFFYILNILQDIFVPLSMACLLAILLNPMTNRLQRKLPRGIAIFISLLTALVVVSAVMYFLSTQIATFSASLPALKAKFLALATDGSRWINERFGIATEKQIEMLKHALQNGQSYLGATVNTIMGTIGVVVLVPIYVFFLLYYKPLILDFLFHIFSEKHSLRVAEILSETKGAVQSYIVGLLIEMVIVSAMNSIALLLLGVRSAILIGVIGGILNMIPYLGGLIAIILPILMATVTSEGYSTQLAILGAYLVIQFIDNNILVPKIVSSKVKINALISIIIVLLGGAIWGLSGMFLSIPFIAILKIIFDRVDGLRPWGQLLGDKIPEEHAGVKFQAQWQRIFRKKGK